MKDVFKPSEQNGGLQDLASRKIYKNSSHPNYGSGKKTNSKNTKEELPGRGAPVITGKFLNSPATKDGYADTIPKNASESKYKGPSNVPTNKYQLDLQDAATKKLSKKRIVGM